MADFADSHQPPPADSRPCQGSQVPAPEQPVSLAFSQHDVNALESMSHLIPGNERCGIYVLSFDNGEQYVGQSIDVVTRYASHRRRWADIATLDWHSCEAALLDEREQGVIAAKLAAGQRLRNIRWARGPLAASPLDSTVTPAEQLVWLTGEDPFDAGAIERRVNEEQRIKKHAAFRRLMKTRSSLGRFSPSTCTSSRPFRDPLRRNGRSGC